MAWPQNPRLARSLATMLAQINAAHPKRSKASDGFIGDAAHASRSSDHNPWVRDGAVGVVTAGDFTHDPANGFDGQVFADALRTSRDSRIKYVIHNGRIFSSFISPWTWRPYTGSNPHEHHVHVSIVGPGDPEWLSSLEAKTLYDSTRAWQIAPARRRIRVRARDWKWARWYLGLGEYAAFGARSKGHRPDYPWFIPLRGWVAVRWYKRHAAAAVTGK